MAFGPFSSESTSQQTSTSVSDQGQLIGKKSKVVQGQGQFVDNTKGRLNTGLQVTGGKGKGATNVTINSGLDGSGLEALVGRLTTASTGQVDALTSLLSDQQAQLADLAKAQQADVATLAENKQTEGDSSRNKIVLIVVLAVIGLLGLLIWKK
jgi:hypothetical protein